MATNIICLIVLSLTQQSKQQMGNVDLGGTGSDAVTTCVEGNIQWLLSAAKAQLLIYLSPAFGI